MSERLKPFTIPQRRRLSQQHSYGHRPTNDWGEGNLPAPFAEGDLLHLDRVAYESERLRGMGPGYFVVTCAFSIDDGDAWYFRVCNEVGKMSSDRLHVAYPGRCSEPYDDGVDWMAGFELVDTADPEGLAKRNALLLDGWTFTKPPVCPHCHQRIIPDA